MTKGTQRKLRAFIGKLARESRYYEDREELLDLHFHLRFFTLKDLNIRTAIRPSTAKALCKALKGAQPDRPLSE